MTERKQEFTERHSEVSRQMKLEYWDILEIKSRDERMRRLLEFQEKQKRTYQRHSMERVLLDLPFYFGHYLGSWT